MIAMTKRCQRCRETKVLEDFHRDRARPDGRQYVCKACRTAYSRTPQGKASQRKAERKYRLTKRGRECYRNHRQSHWSRHGTRIAECRRRHPERQRAIRAIQAAVKGGKIPKAAILPCATCGGRAQHYHHRSYAPEHYLDVIPLCCKCHYLERGVA